eukprot:CAMPEP_0184671400 /NCGR_PEP_ID=MMETSP0308-20130426/85473_1 /TAXON_ID=38269 /ORGANISM="Gloeochaete witrockiana, Strain SAG 46.84" /LENGTH=261 /DNA_ID=CAMNT_0027118511 /DNA_START=1055 /DNA_END=1837 /DNA_ORIENTATION=-
MLLIRSGLATDEGPLKTKKEINKTVWDAVVQSAVQLALSMGVIARFDQLSSRLARKLVQKKYNRKGRITSTSSLAAAPPLNSLPSGSVVPITNHLNSLPSGSVVPITSSLNSLPSGSVVPLTTPPQPSKNVTRKSSTSSIPSGSSQGSEQQPNIGTKNTKRQRSVESEVELDGRSTRSTKQKKTTEQLAIGNPVVLRIPGDGGQIVIGKGLLGRKVGSDHWRVTIQMLEAATLKQRIPTGVLDGPEKAKSLKDLLKKEANW